MRDPTHSDRSSHASLNFDAVLDDLRAAAAASGGGELADIDAVLGRFQNAIARAQTEVGLDPSPPDSLPFAPANLIVGTNGPDDLTGTDQNDLVRGRGGDDNVDGAGGLDIVFGGPGNDRLTGEIVFGGRGDDTMVGDFGSRSVDHWFFGGRGNDTIEGSFGDDFIFGGSGNDQVIGNDGFNTIFGGDGNDDLQLSVPGRGAPGGGTAYGGAGDDVIRGGAAADLIFGGTGNDTIFPGEGNDFAFGEEGDDTLGWGALDPVGAGTLDGGPGNDTLFGTQVSPAMFGGDGDDLLRAGRFEPQSAAPDFKLVFDGGPGNDTLDVRIPGGLILSADDIVSGIERILLSGGTLTLDVAGVLGASDETDTLIVDDGGPSGTGRIVATGAWQLTGSQDIDGVTFNQWQLDEATLLVRPTIDFDPA